MANPSLKITCNPEIECSKTGTISDFENIYPGFQTTRSINISNNRNYQCDLKVQAQGANSNSPIYKYTKISFSGNDVGLISNTETLIGTLNPHQNKSFSMRFYVSTKAGNEFANQTEKIDFNFKINCVSPSTSLGTVAGISTTDKSFCSCFWWWVFIIFAVLILIFISRLAKKRE